MQKQESLRTKIKFYKRQKQVLQELEEMQGEPFI